MAPKTGKDEKSGDNAWRKQIESIIINDAKFQFKAVILEGAGTEQDFIYLTKFEDIATEEKRFVIKNISKRETNFMVNQLGGDKKVRDQSLRVFEEAYEAMRCNNKTIPTDILALLIKHKINEMKINYLNVQKEMAELNAGMRRDSYTMLDPVEVKGTAPKPLPEPIESPKQTKKGKKNEVDEVITTKEGKKYNTVLRERGEEWRDKTYVDDFPIDGPNLYVVITGFFDPMLLSGLVTIGVPVHALIQLRVDSKLTKVPSSLIRTTKRGQSQTEVLADQATQFWTNIQKLRIAPDIATDFKNTAFIVFKPPYWESEPLKGEPDPIYDDISFLLYDIQDLSRQHTNYLENMNVMHIVQEDTPNLFYFDRYTAAASQLPNESTTVSLVLDSILQAIDTEGSQDTLIISKAEPPLISKIPIVAEVNEKTKLEKTQQLVEHVFNALQATHKEKQKFVSEIEDTCPFEDPAIIDYGDYLSTISFHFQNNLNINRICTIFNGIVLTRLWNSITKPSDNERAKINYHIKVLTNSFEKSNVELSKLHRLFNILAFRKIFDYRKSDIYTELQTKLDDFKKVYLKRSAFSEPLYKIIDCSLSNSTVTSSRDSLIREISWKSSKSIDEHEEANISNSMIFECPEISELISVTETDSKQVAEHMIDHFEYFEDYDLKSSLQILEKAYNEYNCINYKFCTVTNKILLLFYNTYNDNGIFIEEWKTHLSTPVCMQDFFDFVLDEHYEWLQNEEKAYEDMLEKRYKANQSDDLGSASNRSCIEKDVLDMDMLIDGSLKHEEYIKLETGTPVPSRTDLSTKKSKKSNETASVITTSSKKIASKGEKTAESFKSTSLHSILSLNDSTTKPFLGYDLGDRRIEIFGRDATFFSNDGTKVITKYFILFPHNEEYLNLQVISGNKGAHISIHRPLGIYTKPLLQETVRVLTKNNTQINFQKQSYEEILETENLEQQFQNIKTKKSPILKNEENPVLKYFYSLAITCHNGLVIESVHENKSASVSHIRQYYLTESKPIRDEEKRCISKFGEVIIFKESGEIEILCPDSSYILSSKYERRLIVTESGPGSELDDGDSSKKKGSKEKQTSKAKVKTQKSVSLASLSEKLIQKEPTYEMDFHEFTVIEADGRQKHCSEGILYERDVLLIRTATDYNLGEVFSRRMDGTNLLYNNDGMLTVTFPDDTRIISRFYIDDDEIFPEWTKEEIECFQINKSRNLDQYNEGIPSQKNLAKDSNNNFNASEGSSEVARDDGYIFVHSIFTIEHINYATVTIDTATKEFSVDMPNSVSLSVNNQTQYKAKLDQLTTLTLNSDVLHMDYIACPELNVITSCDINISRQDFNNSEQYLWLRLKDSYGKHLTVNHEGAFEIVEENVIEIDPDEHEQDKLEDIIVPCDKCKENQLSEQFRFIVLNKDFTISELIHKLRIQNYMKKCNSHTWGSISNYDVFDDKRRLISLLLPVNHTQAQKFLMNAKFAHKPKNMVFKDLGKGFYKWMRPYERFKPNPRLPPPPVEPEPPKAFILRTLEKQWRERDRNKFKGGRELIAAIIKYRQTMEEDKKMMTADPVHDPRTTEEIENYERVQELIQKTIDRMQKKLELFEEAECCEPKPLKLVKIPLDRTSEEAVSPQELLEEESITPAATTSTSETTKDLVEELDEVAEMRPSLRRYWRRRAEDEEEMQYYKEILRTGYVPPYFDNILGGAMWYGVNKVIEAATDNDAKAKRPECWCNESEASGDAK